MGITSYWDKLRSIFSLSLSLAKANFKLRNEGSYLGIFWYLLEPLLMFLVILIVTNNMGVVNEDYPIYLLIGLILFNFFIGATTLASNVIILNSNFIKSMNISKEAIVFSKIVQSVFSHFFEILILFVFMVFFKSNLVGIIYYPIIFLFIFLFITGFSFILATMGAYMADIKNVWNVLSKLIWFVTPIFYFVEPGSRLYKINLFNPMFYYIEACRSILIYNKIPSLLIIIGVIVSALAFFILGIIVFQKYKDKIAEVI